MTATLVGDLAIAFLAATPYGILFSVPRRTLLLGGVAGLLGWFAYVASSSALGLGEPGAALCGSVLVSVVSEVFARWTRHPATVFIVPGLIPLVPGIGAYRTMLLLLQGQVQEGVAMGVQTALFAGGVAAGLLFVGSAFRALRHRRL